MMADNLSFQDRLFSGFAGAADRQAVIYGEKIFTYSELAKKCRDIAEMIFVNGIKSGSFIGIYLEDRVDLICAILGILKTGCVFVPLDCSYPSQRVRKMIGLVDLEYIISDDLSYRKLAGGDSAISGKLKPLFIGAHDFVTESEKDGASPAIEGRVDYSLEDKIYVYFTSGTDGTPKAIVGKNKSLLHFINWEIETFKLDGGLRISQLTTPGFDAFLRDIFVPLCSGGSVCIPENDLIMTGDSIIDWIDKNKVELIHCVPSVFRLFNTQKRSGYELGNLKYILLSGERINPGELKNWYKIFAGRIQLVNLYGPTETTMIKTFYFIREADIVRERIPIGKPLKGARVLILDRNLKVCKQYVTGEIYIRTPFMTTGYYNDERLNREHFIPNPFNNDKNDLFFRTGDLGRVLADGNIDFLGRKDRRVKIRGVRVELDEVEQTILKHSLVNQAVVIDKEGDDFEKFLCAYIVLKRNGVAERGEGKIGHGRDRDFYESTGDKIEDSGQSILGLFSEQVDRYHDKVALKAGPQNITYGYLDDLSNHIGREIVEKYDDRYKLTRDERCRYQRQTMLHNWGIAAQEKIKATTVFVGGAGGSASALISQLALIGFGTIIVCDFDKVELSNLNRQCLHDDSRIGMNKALSAEMTIKRINPHVNVKAYSEKITADNVYRLVGEAALIFDNIDDMRAKFLLSECAAVKGIPHIISSMIDMNSYAAIFYPPLTPCFHCLYDKGFVDDIEQARQEMKVGKNPLPVVASSLFLSTSFVVNEALKFILGFEEVAYNRYFLFNQQRAADIADSPGYKLIVSTFSEHFKALSRKQGLDWDEGRGGNFLEEIVIEKDPGCLLCGNENGQKAISAGSKDEGTRMDEGQPQGVLQSVALLCDFEMGYVSGMLGALKADKTFVSLDAAIEKEDLKYIVEDSEARIIVTNNHYYELADTLRNEVNRNIEIVNVDSLNLDAAAEEFRPQAHPDPVAALLYVKEGDGTWNSLKQPQKNILHTITAHRNDLSVCPDDKLSLFYAFDTDISLADTFLALLSGATLYPYNIREKTNLYTGAEDRRYLLDPQREAVSEIREFLEAELVSCMVPNYIMPIDEIPLLPNGKIDRKNLPEPEIKRDLYYVPPKDDIEKKLVDIWSEVLEIPRDVIGTHSNFFELGGHSLRAIVLTTRIHKALHVKIPLVQIFKTQTISGLSAYLKAAVRIKYTSIEPIEMKEYYRLSSGQKRMYFLQQMDLESTTYNSQLRVSIGGNLIKDRFERSFQKLTDRHEGFRTSFVLLDDEPVQRISDKVGFAVEYYDIKEREYGAAGEAGMVAGILKDFVRPFDLSRAPVMRAGLIQLGSEKYILMVDIHHIITDAFSRGLIIKDLMAIYEDRETPALRLQYKDYVEWQNNEDQRESLKKQEEYWLREFSSEIPELHLPTDYPETAVDDSEGVYRVFSIEREEMQRLKEIARNAGATLFMIMTALFNVFLSKLSGQEDIIIGNVVIGRRHIDLEKIIGVFINPLAFRNFPEAEKRFPDFLKEVKERALDAFDNQDYPFEDLVLRLVKKREPGRNGIYDVEFALFTREMQEMLSRTPELADLKLADYPVGNRSSKKERISLVIFEFEEKMLVYFYYWENLFKEDTVLKFIDTFNHIIAAVIQTPEIRLKDIEIISQEQKSRAISEIRRAQANVQADFDI